MLLKFLVKEKGLSPKAKASTDDREQAGGSGTRKGIPAWDFSRVRLPSEGGSFGEIPERVVLGLWKQTSLFPVHS